MCICVPEYPLYILISNTISKKKTLLQDNDEKNSDRQSTHSQQLCFTFTGYMQRHKE